MYASLGTTAFLGTPATTNQAILGMVPRNKYVDRRFLRYWLQALKPHLRYFARSNTQDNLNAEVVGNLPFPSIQADQQLAIADYLDRETERIDRLVEKKRRLIELLEEKRTALISHAVTKGLDPTVPMKGSGIPWVGEIPAHWLASKIKYVARPGTGHTPSRQHPEYWEDCNVPWMTLADVWQLRNGWTETVSETHEKVSSIGLANSSSRTASVGFSGVMGADMATSQDFVTWTCGDDLDPYYLLYVFRSMQAEFSRLTMGSTHKTIYMPDALAVAGPVPPRNEQDRIVESLRSRLVPMRSAIDKLGLQLDKLSEYRQALITAAVTGQLDIAAEPKDPEEVVA
jgi:type I restriction enzyme S subunit